MDWTRILTIAFFINILAAAIKLATPLVLAAIGEIFAERSGVLNLGIEGIMLTSGFVGFSAAHFSENLWIGLVAGILSGTLLGLFFAFMVISLKTDQIVTGLSLLIFSNGLAIYLYRIFFGSSRLPQVTPFRKYPIPGLSDIPIIGSIFFNQNILTYLMFGLVIVSTIVIYRTIFGLRSAAVGESPAAADTVGINVNLNRYLSVMLGGAFAGMAGAYFPLAELGFYSNTMIGGRGYIALALVVFGKWNPLLALLGGIIFGIINAVQIRFQLMGSDIPSQFLIMMPYALTILALIIGKGRKAPSFLTIPYTRE